MIIVFDIGLLLALLIGGAIGLLVTAGHYEQIALRRWTYEKEIAENRELYVALGTLRRIKPDHAPDDDDKAKRRKPEGPPGAPAGCAGRVWNLGSPSDLG